jgi:hypothetical protein
VTEPEVVEPVDVDALLASAYARSVGVELGSVDDVVAELRAAVGRGEVTAASLGARRAGLRRVEARCIVSRVQAVVLDRVLAV